MRYFTYDDTERSKREAEAEAIVYVVGRYFDLDVDGSAFYSRVAFVQPQVWTAVRSTLW